MGDEDKYTGAHNISQTDDVVITEPIPSSAEESVTVDEKAVGTSPDVVVKSPEQELLEKKLKRMRKQIAEVNDYLRIFKNIVDGKTGIYSRPGYSHYLTAGGLDLNAIEKEVKGNHNGYYYRLQNKIKPSEVKEGMVELISEYPEVAEELLELVDDMEMRRNICSRTKTYLVNVIDISDSVLLTKSIGKVAQVMESSGLSQKEIDATVELGSDGLIQRDIEGSLKKFGIDITPEDVAKMIEKYANFLRHLKINEQAISVKLENYVELFFVHNLRAVLLENIRPDFVEKFNKIVKSLPITEEKKVKFSASILDINLSSLEMTQTQGVEAMLTFLNALEPEPQRSVLNSEFRNKVKKFFEEELTKSIAEKIAAEEVGKAMLLLNRVPPYVSIPEKALEMVCDSCFAEIKGATPLVLRLGFDYDAKLDFQKKLIKEYLKDCPSALLYANIHKEYLKWQPEDLKQSIRLATEKNKINFQLLSQINIESFGSEDIRDIGSSLFKAYVLYRPDYIIEHIKNFSAWFSEMPEAERKIIIEKFLVDYLGIYNTGKKIEGKDIILRNFFNAALHFSDADRNRVVGVFLNKHSDIALEKLEELKSDETKILLHRYVGCGDLSTFDTTIKRLGWEYTPALWEDLYLPLRELLRFEHMPEIATTIPWFQSLKKIKGIKAPSSNINYCAWTTEMQPLVDDMDYDSEISQENVKDGEYLFSFIKEFGMYRMSGLFAIYLNLSRGKPLNDEQVGNLREILSPSIVSDFLSSKIGIRQIINEIKKVKNRLQSELIAGVVPDEVYSPIGLEILGTIRRTSSWADGDSADLLKAYSTAKEKNPDLFALPYGYTEQTVEIIPRQKESSEDSAEISKTDPERTTKELLENKNLVNSFGTMADAFGRGWYVSDLSVWWQEKKEELVGMLRNKINKADELLSSTETVANDSKRKKIASQKEKIQETIDQLMSITVSKDFNEANVDLLLKCLSPIDGADNILRELSVCHLKMIMPEVFGKKVLRLVEHGGGINPDNVVILADILRHDIRTQYLQTEQRPDHTLHPPFDKELFRKMEAVWQMKEDVSKHIIVKTADRLTVIEGAELSLDDSKKLDITFLPSKGVLRVFSGDIGDACYTSEGEELANGDYPGIVAVTIINNRGMAKESIEGSILFVEAVTTDGEKVLNIRANNPRENLMSRLDPADYLRALLDYAIEIAESRGIEFITVPLDPATQSSSNRTDISGYYQANFSSKPKLALKESPETGFNGYDNWNSQGGHPVVVVWERPERDYYPDNW